jgi:hypothetical protein
MLRHSSYLLYITLIERIKVNKLAALCQKPPHHPFFFTCSQLASSSSSSSSSFVVFFSSSLLYLAARAGSIQVEAVELAPVVDVLQARSVVVPDLVVVRVIVVVVVVM